MRTLDILIFKTADSGPTKFDMVTEQEVSSFNLSRPLCVSPIIYSYALVSGIQHTREGECESILNVRTLLPIIA